MKTRVIGTPGSSLSRLIAFAESLNDKTLVELFQCFGSPLYIPTPPFEPHDFIPEIICFACFNVDTPTQCLSKLLKIGGI